MELYSSKKRIGLCTPPTAWVNLKDVILNDRVCTVRFHVYEVQEETKSIHSRKWLERVVASGG